ncbi:MAG: hypothetical protein IJX71_01430 [Oscillospiraceae bacterium]|nr:hypothetical protein [Oscillospiraceae bacterium]
MDRMKEYKALLEEFQHPVPGLDGTLERAKTRRRKKLLRPLQIGLTTAAAFVLLVNFCAPVAYACAQVPVLRELAEFVNFSQPLSQAVENEYAQVLELEETQGEITASIEYLIVDRKQVNLFYRIDGPEEEYYVECSFEDREGGCVIGSSPIIQSGQLGSVQIEFIDREVPEHLDMVMQVCRQPGETENAPQNTHDASALEEPEREVLAEFQFALSFDPAFMAPTKTTQPGQTFTVAGQAFTIDLLEVYPTGIRFHVQAEEENSMWLAGLTFHLETEDGERLDSVTNGVSASGEEGSPAMVNYFADSSYFYDSDDLTLVITGAELREKEQNPIRLDPISGTLNGTLPEAITLKEVQRQGESLSITFHYPRDRTAASVVDDYIDSEGNKVECNMLSTTHDWEDESYDETHTLLNCPQGELLLTLRYDNYVETEIILPIAFVK